MSQPTLDFARQHAADDVRRLALQGCNDPQVDLTAALQQIQGRQTARQKLPSWAAVEGVVYPPHLNMEQCSSEQTARYKARVAQRLLSLITSHSSLLLDLTGGFGVDFYWMSDVFDRATYVECDASLCAIVAENLAVLGRSAERVSTICGDGPDVLRRTAHATMLFLDPARRDGHGGRTYAIADCTPNVLLLRDELLARADYTVLKLSPMLDWRKAVADLGRGCVSEVHIVSVGGECRELLLVMQRDAAALTVYCVNDGQEFAFSALSEEAQEGGSSAASATFARPEAGAVLLVPNASVMKAGCFAELSRRFGVAQVAANSHLFTSAAAVEGFPGRQFRVERVTSLNRRELRTALSGLSRANIATRNFPLSPDQLRQRLKLSEGGSKYIFATTLASGEKVLILCERLGPAC